jgi:CubicO group peptidase (beta-lactamase class C family)
MSEFPTDRVARCAVLAAIACACSISLACAGERLAPAELKPAPAFDAGDAVPGRSSWALGNNNAAATYRSLPEILPSRRIAAGPAPSPLAPPTRPFDVRYRFEGKEHSVAEFTARTDTTGLLILKGEQILFEGYYQGADPQDQFISFSTGKSFVSTLVAFALGDGKLRSIDDPIINYLPELAGSAYEKARIRDVLEMSSGTSYSEEYEDPKSDIAAYAEIVNTSSGGLYDFARSFKPLRPPGHTFYYASTDTEILGALVARVTGQSLSAYMSAKLWQPIGAEAAARWLIDQPGAAGREMAAGGLLLRLRDFGRFGLLFANGGRWHGAQLLPPGWVEQATRPQDPQVQYGKLEPGYPLGYGFQWWCLPGPHRPFTAQGIHGQFVLVDPVEHVVMVKLSSWAHAWEDAKEAETYALFAAVAEALR